MANADDDDDENKPKKMEGVFYKMLKIKTQKMYFG